MDLLSISSRMREIPKAQPIMVGAKSMMDSTTGTRHWDRPTNVCPVLQALVLVSVLEDLLVVGRYAVWIVDEEQLKVPIALWAIHMLTRKDEYGETLLAKFGMRLSIASAVLEDTTKEWLRHHRAEIVDLGHTPESSKAPRVIIQAKYPITPDTLPQERHWRIWRSMLDAMERFPHMAPYSWLVYTFTQHDYEPLSALIIKEVENFTGMIAEESVEIICLGRDYEQGIQFTSNRPLRIALATDGASVSYTNTTANWLADPGIHMPQNLTVSTRAYQGTPTTKGRSTGEYDVYKASLVSL